MPIAPSHWQIPSSTPHPAHNTPTEPQHQIYIHTIYTPLFTTLAFRTMGLSSKQSQLLKREVAGPQEEESQIRGDLNSVYKFGPNLRLTHAHSKPQTAPLKLKELN